MSGEPRGAGSLYVETHGDGPTTLLLLHGMGATGAVWRGVIAELRGGWGGCVVVCDLPGHGASARLDDYAVPSVASTLAHGVSADGPVVAAGHSFGGYLALLLASREYGLDVRAAVATGVKVNWTVEELERAGTFASRPPQWFDSYAEAEARYRRVAGLTEDVTSESADLARGVIEREGRFRLSQDLRSVGVGAPDVAGALSSAAVPTLLSRGAADPMVSSGELRALSPGAIDIPGGGHNIHVQRPRAFVDHLVAFVSDTGV